MAHINQTHMWRGYEFKVYDLDVDWNRVAEVGGIYIFAIKESSWEWIPAYIGETGNFADRIPDHEKWEKAMQLAVSHVHVLEVEEEYMRERIEKELIQSYTPRLNEAYW